MTNLFGIDENQKNYFNYEWFLSDYSSGLKSGKLIKYPYKVFGTFICGGGSTMGYKLAGYNHLGGVEIDKRSGKLYEANHKPKYLYIEDLRLFNERKDLPDELYELDILDGSPPCSTFSIAGLGRKVHGMAKKFTEGQAEQILDELPMVYADTINKLKPKVFLMENVKGMLSIGYKQLQAFKNKVADNFIFFEYLLNGADMGLPQNRERVFVIGVNKEKVKNCDFLSLNYNEKRIPFDAISNNDNQKCNLTPETTENWKNAKEGEPCHRFQANKKVRGDEPCFTICQDGKLFHNKYPRYIDAIEMARAGSYPLDFNFLNLESARSKAFYIGMSVPPLMIANIATQIRLQILEKN